MHSDPARTPSPGRRRAPRYSGGLDYLLPVLQFPVVICITAALPEAATGKPGFAPFRDLHHQHFDIGGADAACPPEPWLSRPRVRCEDTVYDECMKVEVQVQRGTEPLGDRHRTPSARRLAGPSGEEGEHGS